MPYRTKLLLGCTLIALLLVPTMALAKSKHHHHRHHHRRHTQAKTDTRTVAPPKAISATDPSAPAPVTPSITTSSPAPSEPAAPLEMTPTSPVPPTETKAPAETGTQPCKKDRSECLRKPNCVEPLYIVEGPEGTEGLSCYYEESGSTVKPLGP